MVSEATSRLSALRVNPSSAPEELLFDDDLDHLQFRRATLTPVRYGAAARAADDDDSSEVLLGVDAFEDEVAKRARTNAVLGALDALLQDGSLEEDRTSATDGLKKVQKNLGFVDSLFSTTTVKARKQRGNFIAEEEKKALKKFDLVEGSRSVYEYRKSEEHGVLGYIRRMGKDVEPLFIRKRMGQKLTYEWSLDKQTWQTVQSNIELSGKRAGAETTKRNMKLIKAFADVEGMRKTYASFKPPSVVDVVVAILFGLINGAFMGMGDMFRTALRHPACAPLFEKLTVTFTKTCKMAIETIQGMFSASVRDRLNLTRAKLWERFRGQMSHLLKDLWATIYKCRPLLMVIGVMIVVMIIAWAITALLASTGFGLIVKVAEIILSLFFSVSFVLSTIKKLWTTMQHCLKGMCSKASAIVIIEHISQLVGIVLGCIFLGSIPKLVQVKNLKNIFKTKNLTQKFGIRFDPTLIKEFQAFKQTMSAVKGKLQTKFGGKVDTGITAGNQARVEKMYGGAKRAFKEAENNVRDAEKALDDAVAALEKVRATKTATSPTGIPLTRERRALERVDAAKRQVEQMRAVEMEAKSAIDDIVRSFPLDHQRWVVDDAIGVVVYEQKFVRSIMDDVSNFASTSDDIERALAMMTKLRGKDKLSVLDKMALSRQRKLVDERAKELMRTIDSMDEQFKVLVQNRKNALPSRDDDLFEAWYAFHRPHSDGFVLDRMAHETSLAVSKMRYSLTQATAARGGALSKEEEALLKVTEMLTKRSDGFNLAKKNANNEASRGWDAFVRVKLEVITEMVKLKDLVLSGQVGGGVTSLFVKSDYKKLGEDKSDYEFEYTIDITGLKDLAMFSPDGSDYAPRILLSTDPGTVLGAAAGDSALQDGLTHVGGRESMTYYTNSPGELHIFVYAIPAGTKTAGTYNRREPFLPYIFRADMEPAKSDDALFDPLAKKDVVVPYKIGAGPLLAPESASTAGEKEDEPAVEVESETKPDSAAEELAAVADADVLVSSEPLSPRLPATNAVNGPPTLAEAYRGAMEQIRRHGWDDHTIDIVQYKPVAAGSTNLAKISAETTVKVVIPLVDMRSKVMLESGALLNTRDSRDWSKGKGSIEVEISLQFQRTKRALSLRPTLLTDAAAENTNTTPFKDLRTLFVRLGKSAKLSEHYVFYPESKAKRSFWAKLNPFAKAERKFMVRFRKPNDSYKVSAEWTYKSEVHWTPVSHHVPLEGRHKGKMPPKDIVLLIRGIDFLCDDANIRKVDWQHALEKSVVDNVYESLMRGSSHRRRAKMTQ